ncbi:MAG: VWA domain-containing protein [Methanobacteriaceae archaeon]|nr:VWA domain-containing protein [Methanobacteriaceae archaeon]
MKSNIKQEQIVALSNLLRNKGMNVSIRSTQTAFKVTNMLSSNSINLLQNSLESVYVKEYNDNKKFKESFQEIFNNKKNNEKIEKIEETENIENNISQSSPMNLAQLQKQNLIPQLKKKRIEDQKILTHNINDRDFFDQEIFELCHKLGVKIANQRSKRKKQSKKHDLNMSKTIRANMKHGGKLINLIKAKPPKKKNNHIFLNDVSGSCEWISSWFFAILYASQQSFNKIKAYDFDNKIVDVTSVLKADTYYESFEKVRDLRMKNRMFNGQSDMYNSFKEFYKVAPLTHRSYVILLSDCREWNGKQENGELASAAMIRKISRKSKKVLILNPENQCRWYNETSCVKDYQKAGAEVYEIGNLEHLANLITKL